MAALPSPTQVAGSHNAIYEAYYHQVDPNSQGSIPAMVAAKFLKKSGLSDVVLSKIWDLSDPSGKGFLNKDGFFVALKLVSLAQSGNGIKIDHLAMDTPPPKVGQLPKILPNKNNIGLPNAMTKSIISGDWAVKPAERAKYNQLFDSLQPLNGFIPGHKVKSVLMESKLPMDTLGKIWDLADMDKDGMLDRHEFMVAMHLVYKALEKFAIPAVLPPELMPPNKQRRESEVRTGSPIPPSGGVPTVPILPAVPPPPVVSAVPPNVPPMPSLIMGLDPPKPPAPPASLPLVSTAPVASAVVAPVPAPPPTPAWCVGPEDRAKYQTLFIQTDVDKDGYVSGHEIKDVFLRSGVPQQILAHIWALCDTKQTGKLNVEQFSLAMWLIGQKLQGHEPPAALTQEMVPPSQRDPAAVAASENGTSNSNIYSNPELDMISKDIEQLAKEKSSLETDIAQKEADIRIKTGEIKSLQSELDTLAATLKQLENQKGEAQKRLNDLKVQRSSVEKELNEVKIHLFEEQELVDKLRRQAEEQEETLRTQEKELHSKKQELEELKQEEASLEQQQRDSKNQLEGLTNNLQNTQLQISQTKSKISNLQEQQRQMSDAIAIYESALQNGEVTVNDASLSIDPEFRDPDCLRLAALTNNENDQTFENNNKDPFSAMNGPSSTNDTFGQQDPFKDDPFSNSSTKDPFSSNDPFNEPIITAPAQDAFEADPFAALHAPTAPVKSDPFDPFNDINRKNSKTPIDGNKDAFGCDPFAALHPASAGPPPRPESPSPALPPKKAKPPPRPAPPRPAVSPGVMRAAPALPSPSPEPTAADPFAQNDPFGGGSFADFANFDAKFSNSAPSPPPRPPTSSTSVAAAAAAAASATLNNINNNNNNNNKNTAPGQFMDFPEDPFKDYRYEDPFNIGDPFSDENDNQTTTIVTPISTKHRDPFGMPISTPPPILPPTTRINGVGLDPFSTNFPVKNNTKTSAIKGLPTEDQQLAWAAAESLRLEDERRRCAEQEQAELELALALSRGDNKLA